MIITLCKNTVSFLAACKFLNNVALYMSLTFFPSNWATRRDGLNSGQYSWQIKNFIELFYLNINLLIAQVFIVCFPSQRQFHLYTTAHLLTQDTSTEKLEQRLMQPNLVVQFRWVWGSSTLYICTFLGVINKLLMNCFGFLIHLRLWKKLIKEWNSSIQRFLVPTYLGWSTITAGVNNSAKACFRRKTKFFRGPGDFARKYEIVKWDIEQKFYFDQWKNQEDLANFWGDLQLKVLFKRCLL